LGQASTVQLPAWLTGACQANRRPGGEPGRDESCYTARVSAKVDPEHRIDDLLYDHWEHPATQGVPPSYWREPATRSYRVEVKGRVFRVNQRELLRDFDAAVARWRAWLDEIT
jgi:hypothetical protein